MAQLFELSPVKYESVPMSVSAIRIYEMKRSSSVYWVLLLLFLLLLIGQTLSASAQLSATTKLVQEKLSACGVGTADGKMGGKTRETISWGCTDNRARETSTLVRSQAKYEGDVRNGKPHGHGVLTFPNGGRYEGDFRNNTWHGHGVLTFPDGGRYEGDFRNGKLHGHGVLTYPDGDRYEGGFRNGKKHGHGVLTYSDGDRYEGNFRNNNPHGRGTFVTKYGQVEHRRWNNGCSRGKKTNRAIGSSFKSCGF